MYDFETKLLKCFPRSGITLFNDKAEFIADFESNTYFILHGCREERDVRIKLIECLSRAAFKTEYCDSDKKNAALHNFISEGINEYLGTRFEAADWEDIYHELGNGVNRALCERFVDSGFDMTLLRGEK